MPTASPWWLSLWCVVASFGTYACMYGFRKPFTVAGFDSEPFEAGMKVWLVSAQVLGYMLSKFIGIKVIAEMKAQHRALMLCALILVAEFALLLFALTPPPYSVAFLFLNGLPLGMVFGLVLGFLEGRRLTEAFVAGLCTSFILADGMVKSVGAWVLQQGVPEVWMPFTSGLIFLFPLFGFVWMLRRIPTPDSSDVQARSARSPMSREERRHWLRHHGGGIALIVFAYVLVTLLRSIRADFAPELWQALGTEGQPSLFTISEMWVALGVILASGMVVMIRNNRTALASAFGIAAAGFALVSGAVFAHQGGLLNGFAFMVLIGLGLYLPYVVVHTSIFERLIALKRDPGNIGYFMYLADAFGYLGYVVLMFTNRSVTRSTDLLEWFQTICWWISIPGLIALALAYRLLLRDRTTEATHTPSGR